jgi:hemoglobin
MLNESEIHARIGDDGFHRLVAAFYRRVPNDPILGKMYPPDDLPGAEERLREFLLFRFGGSERYVQQRGHPRLRQRHAPFPIDQAARDRWMKLMDQAFADAALPGDAAAALRAFFDSTATFMMNRASAPE